MKAQEWVAWYDSFAVYPEDNDEWYINRIEQADTIIRDLLAENERLREEVARLNNKLNVDSQTFQIECMKAQLQAAESRAAAAEKYRQVIDDALVCWEMVTTGDALQDLNKLLVITQDVYLDPRVSKPAADLVAQVRRETAEECARIAETFRTPHNSHPLLSGVHISDIIRARFGEGEKC